MAPIIPFHFSETAETLKAKQVSVTVTGGGGGAGWDGEGGGGALRVRVGVGGHHEIGADGGAAFFGTDSRDPTDPPWVGKHPLFAGKLSWKFAPISWLAIVAGGHEGSEVIGPKGKVRLGFTVQDYDHDVNVSPSATTIKEAVAKVSDK